jgi:fatty acid desaturase
MRSNGQDKTQSYKIIELIFAISFIFLRAFLCTFINYNMWLTHLSLITKLSISITYGVGFFWIYTILTIAAKQMPEKNRFAKSLQSSLNFIKAYSVIFIILTFIWAILLPYILTQVCGYEFISLVIKGFIVF